jgi:hypothetical protein
VLRRQLPWLGLRERGPDGGGRRGSALVVGEDPARMKGDTALDQAAPQRRASSAPLATSAAAADVLGRELGVDTEKLHKFLREWTGGRCASRLWRGQPVPPGRHGRP